jgi:hypothetical protein
MSVPNIMDNKFIPAQPTIAELERKAQECEKRAKQQAEPEATALREKAKRYRDWARSLRSGQWTS